MTKPVSNTTDDDALPEVSLGEWLRGLASDPTPDDTKLSAATLRLCLRDERDHARRTLDRFADQIDAIGKLQ